MGIVFRVAALVVASALLPDCAGPPAPGQPSGSPVVEQVSGCLFLVSGLREIDGIQLGDFLVLHVQDGAVTGTGGSLHSEWFEVRGTVSADGGHLEGRDPYAGTWRPLDLEWVPAERTFAGWQHATADELRAWSGGFLPLANQPCG